MTRKKERGQNTMATVLEIFRQEVEQLLPESRKALADLKTNPSNSEARAILYRLAHTLKGSGQMVGLRDIVEPATEMTVVLNLVQQYGVELTAGIMDFLTERLAKIEEEVARLQLRAKLSAFSGSAFENIGRGKKILIVDDDPVITQMVKDRLTKEGFAVIICQSVLAAENYLENGHPDLIVLDIVLPDGNGVDFCRKIRSDPRQQIVPIVFLSVKAELHDKLVGFATGADDYLAKPFDVEELTIRIKAILYRLETYKDWAWLDELTGVYNRRYLHRRLEEEISRAKRTNGVFSIAMIDLDFFKNVNDHFGHSIGDEVLRSLVERMTKSLRGADVVCRYGGDEFVIILPDTPPSEACRAIERLRQIIEHEQLTISGEQVVGPVTISAGVAGFPKNGCSGEELLAAVDATLYRSKEAGRNAVLLCEERKSA